MGLVGFHTCFVCDAAADMIQTMPLVALARNFRESGGVSVFNLCGKTVHSLYMLYPFQPGHLV